MARTILELSKEVCDRATVNAPESIFGSNDRIARILRVAIKDTCRDIMRNAMSNGASGFLSQWVFALKPNIYAYRLPPDFYKIVPGTEQVNRCPITLLGPVTPQTWANWISGYAIATTYPMGWQIKNNLIHIEPVPQVEQLVTISYLSRYVVARDAEEGDLETVNGHNYPIAPLVPRDGYVAEGAYSAVQTTAGSNWGEVNWGDAKWGSTPREELRRIPPSITNAAFPAYQVRAEEFSADTDQCAIDDDHLVSLGMTWRLRKGLSMSYAEARDEYEREKDVFLSNDASRGRDIYFGNDRVLPDVVPLGNGNWSVS